MERPLSGRVALVTGAGVRLGRLIAEGLGRAGADVALHCHRSTGGADEAAATIRVGGNRAGVFVADLSRPQAPAALAAEVAAALGPVDLLVNSASLFVEGPLEALAPETLEQLWALNVRAPLLLCQALAGPMRARAFGSIVNVVDLAGTSQTWRGASAYQATRAALWSLTKSLALELAPAVRVNAVAPGLVLPPPSMGAEAIAALVARIPLGRQPAAADVVETVVSLLVGPPAVTGQLIAVDGGRSLGSS